MTSELQATIEAGWEQRDAIDSNDSSLREAVEAAILRLDSGEERVAEKVDGEWRVNQWLKKAVLLSFRLNPMEPIPGGPGGAPWWDKVPSKFLGWGPQSFAQAGFRAVDRAMQTHGGMGLTNEVGLIHAWHDLRIVNIADGTNEILARTIAQRLLAGDVEL